MFSEKFLRRMVFSKKKKSLDVCNSFAEQLFHCQLWTRVSQTQGLALDQSEDCVRECVPHGNDIKKSLQLFFPRTFSSF